MAVLGSCHRVGLEPWRQMDLQRGTRQKIQASGNVRHPKIAILDDGDEMVGGQVIPAPNHRIPDRCRKMHDVTIEHQLQVFGDTDTK